MRFDAEQVEGALLDLRGTCEKNRCRSAGELDGVACEGREVGEQGAEAVNRRAVIGAFGAGLASSGRRCLSLGDRRRAQCFAGRAIMIVEQHGGERLAHVPFEIIGEHA